MANVTFDGISLASLGVAVIGHNARQMAAYDASLVRVGTRGAQAETYAGHVATVSDFDCFLSADTENWANYTHAQWLARLEVVKQAIAPRKGFRKLVLADLATRYRWARYKSMQLAEQKPWQRLPFQKMGIEFDNYEAYWRLPATPVVTGVAPTALPNTGDDDTKPVLTLTLSGTVEAYSSSIVHATTLLTIDDLSVGWAGAGDLALYAGDKLKIDSETCTVLRQSGGSGPWRDVVRAYDSSGAGIIDSDFPNIAQGGATLSYLNPAISSLTVEYDLLKL